MPRFLRTYDYKVSGSFRGAPLKIANGWLAAGSLDGNGLVALIGFDGEPIWQKRYAIAGKKLTFNGLLRTGNKIFVYGVITIGTKRADNLLIQISLNGDLVNWANLPASKPAMAIYSDFSRYNIDLAELSNGRLLCCGWFNQFGSNDHAELFVISLTEGRLVQAANFYVTYDTQIYNAATAANDPQRSFVYLAGMAQAGSNQGLFAVIGYKNTFADTRTSHLLQVPNSDLTQVFTSYILPNKGHLIAGTYTKTGQTGGDTLFIAQITTDDENANPTLVVNKSFGLRFGGEDKRVTSIVKFGNQWLVTGFLTQSVVSFVICLDQDLKVVWIKSIQTGTRSVLSDAELFDNENLAFTGYITDASNLPAPSLLYTDKQLGSCKTKGLTWELIEKLTFTVTTTKTISTFNLYASDAGYAKIYFPDILVTNAEAKPIPQCPEKDFTFSSGEKMPQSPFLHLQAAGSLGMESTAGIHLRWTLLRALGDKHLPKGTYVAAAVNFNKPNDFAYIYRIPYNKAATTFSLVAVAPVFKDHAQARWRYNVPGLGNVDLWFLNKTKYASIGINTATNLFLDAYRGEILEVELKDTLAFAVEITLAVTGNYTLEAETLGAESNYPLSPKVVTARQRFTQASVGVRRLLSENLRSIRLRLDNGSLTGLAFETYDAFLAMAVQSGEVAYIGSFSLTQDQTLAFNRLEDKPRAPVHGIWKKFNEDAFVNTANYQKRWNQQGGIKYGIDKYLALSNTASNPTAVEQINDYPDVVSGGKAITVSYLDMLLLASTDFHAARMMGLGHIDTPIGGTDAAYMYLVEYSTLGDLEDGKGARPVQHLYLSLPTATKDQRLPEEVIVKNISYGLNDQGDVVLTDAGGYTPDGMVRYINVFAALKTNPVSGNTFFVPNILFSASDYTNAVFAGMEYRKKTETTWRKPEIAHHTELSDPTNALSPKLFLDTKGVPETAILLFYEGGTKPSLIHKETEAGFHEYAAYPVNIFSRSGAPVLAPVSTDETKFTKRNTLLPPSDIRVQLIQKEAPLILTSADEQTMLQNLTGDKTLVRLLFNYAHIQDSNYDFGDQFEVFFRQEMPDQVTGRIEPPILTLNTKQSELVGKDYTFLSNGETSVPIIPLTKRSRYIGGVFVHDGKRFEIKDLTDAGSNYPKFKLQHLEERTVITNGSQQTISVGYVGPKDPDKKPFMAIENMANAANWGAANPLTLKINIETAQWSVKNETQGDFIKKVRGIWDKAKIKIMSITETWYDANNVLQTNIKPNAYYEITFDTFQLKKHSQWNTAVQNVNWYNGIIRIRLASSGKFKDLKVFKIDQKYNTTTNLPSAPLVLLAGDDTLTPGEFLLNTSMEVNFYPGYRVYLTADNPKGFNQATIMPATGASFKNTLMGVRTVDLDNGYTSPVGVPAILMAQEETEPAKVDQPQGPEYAAPPDVYNKSTYTFTAKFPVTEPFAVVMYRADINALLNVIYTAAISKSVKQQLDVMQPDPYWVNRWKDFINPTGTSFKAFPNPVGGNYTFPNPDKITGSFNTVAIMDALRSAFVPITKQPMLLRDIKLNTAINQSLPALWNGTDKKITFTDFTLDGGMNTAYFYFSRDVSSRMQMGDGSPILGPVQLVNTRPPSALIISKVISCPPNPTAGTNAAVQFDLLAPPFTDKVVKVSIYRAMSSVDGAHVRSMKQIKEVDISALSANDGILSIKDDFQGEEIPYGDPLHYRLIGLRKVEYKDFNNLLVTIHVPSLPSKLCMVNVMDTVNPAPPTLSYSVLTTTSSELKEVTLSWAKTTYKGKYSLFKMTDRGQWNKLYEFTNTANSAVLTVKLLNTTFASDDLPILDNDGNKIFHHFKIGVESASGLLNLYDEVLTMGGI